MSFLGISSMSSNLKHRKPVSLPSGPKTTIDNKVLYYNMEQSPPVNQWNTSTHTTTVSSTTPIGTTRAKYGTKSATSDGLAFSNIFFQTTNSVSITTTGISYSMWFYITAKITSGDCKIFEAGGNNINFIRIPNNTTTFLFCDRGSAVNFTLNQWNHVVGCINSSGNSSVYLNGSLITSFTDLTVWRQSLGNVFVCRSTLGWHNSILGSIDDFRIYSKVLSQAEVQAIYNNMDN